MDWIREINIKLSRLVWYGTRKQRDLPIFHGTISHGNGTSIFAEHMIAIRLTRRKYPHGTSLGGNGVLCKVERDIKILTGARDYTVSCGNLRDFHNAVKIPRKALVFHHQHTPNLFFRKSVDMFVKYLFKEYPYPIRIHTHTLIYATSRDRSKSYHRNRRYLFIHISHPICFLRPSRPLLYVLPV